MLSKSDIQKILAHLDTIKEFTFAMRRDVQNATKGEVQ